MLYIASESVGSWQHYINFSIFDKKNHFGYSLKAQKSNIVSYYTVLYWAPKRKKYKYSIIYHWTHLSYLQENL